MQAELLRAVEVADRLGVHPTTVQRWARSGKLKPAFVTPGYRGALLFDPETVEAHLEAVAS